MSQGKLINVEKVENGIKLTFLDYENKEVSGIYNNKILNEDDLKKLIGHHVSFSNNKENEDIDVHKAWEANGRPSFCDDLKHGFDR